LKISNSYRVYVSCFYVTPLLAREAS